MSLLLLVPSAPGFAEEHIKEISVNLADVSLKEAIQQIEKVSGYSFFYDENKINIDSRISLNASNESLSKVLDNMLRSTGLAYEISNNQIVLFVPASTSNSSSLPGTNQQQKVVKGKVLDSSGTPVIGANIVEKGTTNGTISDMDGNFSLNVGNKAILIVSYIGYKEQAVVVPAGGVI